MRSKDKDRLDWIRKHCFRFEIHYGKNINYSHGYNVREVIDAAIKAERGGKHWR